MAVSRETIFAHRTSTLVVGLTVVTCLCAVIAAAPTASARKSDASAIARHARAPQSETLTGVRPLGVGPAIEVGRAYDSEDEDCTLAVTRTTDKNGRVRVTHGVACAN
jgi:hypothetical protein